MKRNPVAWAALAVSTAALLSSTGVLRPMPAAPKIAPESQKTADALSKAYESVAEFVKPSVVQISVEKKVTAPNLRNFRFPMPGPDGNRRGPQGPGDMKDFEDMLKRFFGPDGQLENQQFGGRGSGVGSGFVYDDKGHILTNNHVVEGSEKITVTFHDGVDASATVVGRDAQSDVAVIKVDNTSYPALPRGDSRKLKVGELVMAVGSPFELSQTFTVGIISATNRNAVGINEFESFLQTDAAINPGNSGGPLVNMSGEAVGVNSAIVTGGRGNDGIGFTIPIDMAQTVADQLIKDGKVHRARIGVVMEPLTPVLAKQLGLDADTKGILVNSIAEGSPAEKAGLKQGDVIVGYDGKQIESLPAFRLDVSTREVGKSFEIDYYRGGKPHKTTITPAPYEDVVFDLEGQRKPSRGGESESSSTAVSDFGLEVQPLTPELSKSLGLAEGTKGLVVTDVKENSPAEAGGIQTGDVITKIIKDQQIQPVTNAKDFAELASKSDELAFYVQTRDAGGRFVSLSKAESNK